MSEVSQREKLIEELRASARLVVQMSLRIPGRPYYQVDQGDLERLKSAYLAVDAASQPQEGRS